MKHLGGYHDAIGVDVCGNIYLTDYNTAALYRITEDGQKVQTFWDPEDRDQHGHGLRWGNGVGPWKETALYLPQPYIGNTVVEIDIGVPSAHAFTGDVVGTLPF